MRINPPYYHIFDRVYLAVSYEIPQDSDFYYMDLRKDVYYTGFAD